jgi:glycerol-3-phosphate acyltransferase PlsX
MARIAIDLHGGDFGPSIIIPSAIQFFLDYPEHCGVLVGDSRIYRSYVQNCPPNMEWVDADPIGEIAHKPSRLLRSDGHSSIEVCFRALSNQDVDAVVSSEHTGVLLTLVTKHAKLHSLLNRPVLASWLPTLKKQTVMLDLGASFTATADQLLAYSAIGVGLLSSQDEMPSLALLNVGTEYFKGPPELRTAHKQLEQWQNLEYQGFVEANNVFHGDLDIIVCDGFTGNSVIKSSEGALELTFNTLRERLKANPISKLLGYWLSFEMKAALKPLDPRHANGALIAGSDLLVIKSHGNAKEKAFYAAIKRSADCFNQQVNSAIWRELDKLIDEDFII